MNTRQNVTSLICERTAKKLSQNDRHVCVVVCADNRRRWYSVGNWHGGQWHQIAGFSEANCVREFLAQFPVSA